MPAVSLTEGRRKGITWMGERGWIPTTLGDATQDSTKPSYQIFRLMICLGKVLAGLGSDVRLPVFERHVVTSINAWIKKEWKERPGAIRGPELLANFLLKAHQAIVQGTVTTGQLAKTLAFDRQPIRFIICNSTHDDVTHLCVYSNPYDAEESACRDFPVWTHGSEIRSVWPIPDELMTPAQVRARQDICSPTARRGRCG